MRKPGKERGIGVGVYGMNGHQIHEEIKNIHGAVLIACCGVSQIVGEDNIHKYADYDDLLKDPQVDLVSICSPVRFLQGKDIRKALQAGKHVLAEKPCVMTTPELESLISLAQQKGLEFFEMAGTAFDEPYATAREIVQKGLLGEIVQFAIQKSYPYAEWRPQDEQVDGGLIMQSGIHMVRMIEHVGGCRVREVAAIETGLGNPKPGGLMMAACVSFKLENGGLATAGINYLNQRGNEVWGYESMKIFGKDGFIETNSKSTVVFLANSQTVESVACLERVSYLQQLVDYLLGKRPRPLDIDQEFHPTRVVITAKESARQGGVFLRVG